MNILRDGYNFFGLRVPPMSGFAFIGFGGECRQAAAEQLRLLLVPVDER